MNRETLIEAMALDAYNRWRTARRMKPVDYIGANNTPELNAIRDDMRAALTAIAPLIEREVVERCAKVALQSAVVAYRSERPVWGADYSAAAFDAAAKLYAMCGKELDVDAAMEALAAGHDSADDAAAAIRALVKEG